MINDLPDLGIHKNTPSKRLFFAKASESDTVWHILDFAISQAMPLGLSRIRKYRSMALHGDYILPAMSADTIVEIQAKATDSESLCSGCLEAFNIAKEVIAQRERLSFSPPKRESIIINPATNKPFLK